MRKIVGSSAVALLAATAALYGVIGPTTFWTGLSTGLFLSAAVYFLSSFSLHDNPPEESFGRLIGRYFMGALLLRVPVMIALFCVALFVLKIDIVGVLAGLTAGIVLTSAISLGRMAQLHRHVRQERD